MAIFQPGGLTASISGALGGVVFANTKGSKVVRHRPRQGNNAPKNISPLNTNPRAAFATITQAWRDLDTDEKQTWRNVAAQTPAPNRLGQSRPLTGFQLYTRYSLALWPINLAPATTPPTLGTALPPTDLSISIPVAGNKIITVTQDPAESDAYALVYLVQQYRNNIAWNPTNYRQLYLAAAGSSPIMFNISATIANYFGTIVAGQAFWTKVRIYRPGYRLSPPRYASCLAT